MGIVLVEYNCLVFNIRHKAQEKTLCTGCQRWNEKDKQFTLPCVRPYGTLHIDTKKEIELMHIQINGVRRKTKSPRLTFHIGFLFLKAHLFLDLGRGDIPSRTLPGPTGPPPARPTSDCGLDDDCAPSLKGAAKSPAFFVQFHEGPGEWGRIE